MRVLAQLIFRVSKHMIEGADAVQKLGFPLKQAIGAGMFAACPYRFRRKTRKTPMFKGSFVALITPFRKGKVDEKAFGDFVEWQIAQGTHGLVPEIGRASCRERVCQYV